jgi:hypothetical protein
MSNPQILTADHELDKLDAAEAACANLALDLHIELLLVIVIGITRQRQASQIALTPPQARPARTLLLIFISSSLSVMGKKKPRADRTRPPAMTPGLRPSGPGQ